MIMPDDDKPPKLKIDILAMELEQKLPHWLSPSEKNPEAFEAIRRKHRDKWLAEQKKKREK